MERSESNYSIKKRLSAAHGFRMDAIELLECDFLEGKCMGARFALNGVGMSSDFHTFSLASQFDIDPFQDPQI